MNNHLMHPIIGCIVVVVGGGRDGEPTPQCPDVFYRWKENTRKDGIICAMQETINDDRTVAGGGKDMILASRYIPRRADRYGVGVYSLEEFGIRGEMHG